MAGPANPPEIEREDFVHWLRPADAISTLMSANGWPKEQAIRTLITRLGAGLVVAAAEHVVWTPAGNGDVERATRRPIPAKHWNPDSVWVPDADLWETGDIYFELTDGSGYMIHTKGRINYFGVRFDFAGINGMLATTAPEQTNQPQSDDRPPLSKADAERFCRAILAGWGDGVTQEWAYEKAVLFFPDKKVARDTFRSILRSIRGPMKPGKRGKTAE